MQDPWIDERFPRLAARGYLVSSPESPAYNCIAWAVGDDQRFWDPVRATRLGGYYWPHGLTSEPSLQNWVAAFATEEFERCESTELEAGYEKVVLYVGADGLPTHAARQLSKGGWASKIGTAQDIEHSSVDDLEDSDYGTVGCVLRRPARVSL